MWQRILMRPGFFQSLPWMDDGQQLWERTIEVAGNEPTILTGLPVVCKKQVHREKRNWCSEHLGSDVEVICCQWLQKCDYSGPGCILINDNWEQHKRWRMAGGTFIHEKIGQFMS